MKDKDPQTGCAICAFFRSFREARSLGDWESAEAVAVAMAATIEADAMNITSINGTVSELRDVLKNVADAAESHICHTVGPSTTSPDPDDRAIKVYMHRSEWVRLIQASMVQSLR